METTNDAKSLRLIKGRVESYVNCLDAILLHRAFLDKYLEPSLERVRLVLSAAWRGEDGEGRCRLDASLNIAGENDQLRLRL